MGILRHVNVNIKLSFEIKKLSCKLLSDSVTYFEYMISVVIFRWNLNIGKKRSQLLFFVILCRFLLVIIVAALASTASYTVSFLMATFFYCRLSGNSWTKVILPQRGDGMLYWQAGMALLKWACGKVRVLLD